MTDTFEAYEADFQLALQEAKAKLAQVKSSSGGTLFEKVERRQLLIKQNKGRNT